MLCLQVNFQGQRQPFADGGGTDNLAVNPLLRRKVETIVACVATSEPVLPDTTADHWAAIQVRLLCIIKPSNFVVLKFHVLQHLQGLELQFQLPVQQTPGGHAAAAHGSCFGHFM
jgi:hypothetical protein